MAEHAPETTLVGELTMHPDILLVNGKIHTQAAELGVVSALAIRGSEIVAAGDAMELQVLAGPATDVLDLGGRLVLPGLTDAHCHFQNYALAGRQLNVRLPNKQAVLDAVAARVATLTHGEWILGHGWSQMAWGGEFPSAADLDAVAPDNPVHLTAQSMHMSWVNSAALQLAKITAASPEPEGGSIGRDESGAPNGVLFERASNLITAVIPRVTPEEVARTMVGAQETAWKLGLTGIHDYDGRTAFIAFQQLRSQGQLGLRVVKNIPVAYLDQVVGLGLRSGLGDEWLRIGNIKVFVDGALGSRTATMIAPYEGEPDNYGMDVTDKEELYEYASRASANGLSMTVHAIGDRANHDLLEVYAAVREEEAERGDAVDSRRHRAEHVQILHPDDYTRLGKLQVIASMQPIHATSDYEMSDLYWGARGAGAYAWRTQLEAGVVLAFGSDAPVEPIGPLTGIHAAVTRRRSDGSPGPEGWYPKQRLTVDEAVRAYTAGPAFAAYMEDRLGALTPGRLADLVVLDHDIYECDPMEINKAEVMGTMVGGEWKYRKPELA